MITRLNFCNKYIFYDEHPIEGSKHVLSPEKALYIHSELLRITILSPRTSKKSKKEKHHRTVSTQNNIRVNIKEFFFYGFDTFLPQNIVCSSPFKLSKRNIVGATQHFPFTYLNYTTRITIKYGNSQQKFASTHK